MPNYDTPAQSPKETAGEGVPNTRSHSGRAVKALLMIVSILLVLIVALQYSFKQDLPATRKLHALLNQADAVAIQTQDLSADDPFVAYEGGDTAFAVDLDETYYAYLSDTLLPEYGLASEADVSLALQSGYRFSGSARPAHCTGVVSAAITDTDNDGIPELIALIVRDIAEHFPLELHVYTAQNGVVIESAPDGSATLMELFDHADAADSSVEVVGDADSSATYVLLHSYSGEQSAPSDRYVAFDVTGGKATCILDGACTYYDGAAVLVCSKLPAWLSERATPSTQVTDAGSALTGKLLYADGTADFDLNGKKWSYPTNKDLFADAPEATAAMLGPLVSAERIKLLDPISLDWTGFRFALTDDDA